MLQQIKVNKRCKKIDASGSIDKLNLIKPYHPALKEFQLESLILLLELQHEHLVAKCEKATWEF